MVGLNIKNSGGKLVQVNYSGCKDCLFLVNNMCTKPKKLKCFELNPLKFYIWEKK